MVINKQQLFTASCVALLVTSLSFGIRAGILNTLGVQFQLDKSQLGSIAATAFWGFPLAVIIGGFLVDVVGMKKLLVAAFVFHLAGILLTIFAKDYWSLFISTLLVGIANGTVEAACNPLVASLYPDNKTTKLNHFHLWFPGGIFLGTLIVFLLNRINIGWQVQVAVMIIPTLVYGFLFSKLNFPVTERVAGGVSTAAMYKSLGNPLFWFMMLCMLGTAITELFTGQWIEVLLKNVTDHPLLILTMTAGVMVVGRGFAGSIVHRLSPQGVLLISAVLATIGMYMLGHVSGNLIFAGALVFGMGVCYFWPTMIGFVAEYLPKTGAVGLNLMGGAGMFAVSIYTWFMGGHYDDMVKNKLPTGADMAAYKNALPGTDMANQWTAANSAAGPDILNTTTVIPILLTVAFTGLYFYMRGKAKPTLTPAEAALKH
ncbi:MAG: MFS transporter [Bacteroidetes bacterium]|nr:MAG: MFS transporter [Bacteroidota bacterium]